MSCRAAVCVAALKDSTRVLVLWECRAHLWFGSRLGLEWLLLLLLL